jgi:subtilisin family serine protease
VSVAGSDPVDALYGWSTYGAWVSLVAPGCNPTTMPGSGYGEFCGTSSAAALVSGIAALARSAAPAASADGVSAALTGTSTGLVDAAAALSAPSLSATVALPGAVLE